MDARLQSLIGCHSTPGDEGEVRDVLEACWKADGLFIERLGDYAVTVRVPSEVSGKPVLLICAHMDSPGYSIDRLRVAPCANAGLTFFGVTELGSPGFDGKSVEGVLKTRRGKFNGTLSNVAAAESEPDLRFTMEPSEAAQAEVRHGDRICFTPRCRQDGHVLESPFLDNRLGCWMLARLAVEARAWQTKFQLVLGATACEEMCGSGARVLAAHVRPDLALVLDTTYESGAQNVLLGKGPVLTLSDASILLSPALRDRVLDLMAQAGVPMQTEVYNFSGTDARAFPQQGLTCPVLPLLVPTRGNHAPREMADLRDVEIWLSAIRAVAELF